MPKIIDPRVIALIKKAFLERNPRPTYAKLAAEFQVSKAKIADVASKGKWVSLREAGEKATAAGKIEGAKALVRSSANKVDAFDALNTVIADITAETTSVDAKSKEGCANALANLLKVQRELFPPDVNELAEIAVKLNIKPADFLRAIKEKWQENEQLQQTG